MVRETGFPVFTTSEKLIAGGGFVSAGAEQREAEQKQFEQDFFRTLRGGRGRVSVTGETAADVARFKAIADAQKRAEADRIVREEAERQRILEERVRQQALDKAREEQRKQEQLQRQLELASLEQERQKRRLRFGTTITPPPTQKSIRMEEDVRRKGSALRVASFLFPGARREADILVERGVPEKLKEEGARELIFGETGKQFIGVSTTPRVIADVTAKEIRQTLSGVEGDIGFPVRVVSEFIPETPGELAIVGGTIALLGGGGIIARRVTSGVLLGITAPEVFDPDNSPEVRTAAAIISVGGLIGLRRGKGLKDTTLTDDIVIVKQIGVTKTPLQKTFPLEIDLGAFEFKPTARQKLQLKRFQAQQKKGIEITFDPEFKKQLAFELTKPPIFDIPKVKPKAKPITFEIDPDVLRLIKQEKTRPPRFDIEIPGKRLKPKDRPITFDIDPDVRARIIRETKQPKRFDIGILGEKIKPKKKPITFDIDSELKQRIRMERDQPKRFDIEVPGQKQVLVQRQKQIQKQKVITLETIKEPVPQVRQLTLQKLKGQKQRQVQIQKVLEEPIQQVRQRTKQIQRMRQRQTSIQRVRQPLLTRQIQVPRQAQRFVNAFLQREGLAQAQPQIQRQIQVPMQIPKQVSALAQAQPQIQRQAQRQISLERNILKQVTIQKQITRRKFLLDFDDKITKKKKKKESRRFKEDLFLFEGAVEKILKLPPQKIKKTQAKIIALKKDLEVFPIRRKPIIVNDKKQTKGINLNLIK